MNFDGMEIGINDIHGKSIKCGQMISVKLHTHKKSMLKGEWEVIRGVIAYNVSTLRFEIRTKDGFIPISIYVKNIEVV